MKGKFDTIVIGLGAMGSASVYRLAERRNSVLGIDQFRVPHDYGSTHGESRIIRQAIGEGEQYMPLVLRSYELWRDLEKETGQRLLKTTGGLIMEPEKSDIIAHGRHNFLAQTISCANKFRIRHEILETKEIKARFPQFALTNELGYFEYDTGYLRPELCVEAQLHLAKSYGAKIQMNEKVTSITPTTNSGITVTTDRSVYEAEKLVLSAGPWVAQFLPPEYADIFKVYRQVMYWFKIKDDARPRFSPKRFPIFIWIFEKGGDFGFYGFPTLDGKTIKIAGEQYSVSTSPGDVERIISKEETGAAYSRYVQDRFPGLSDICETAVSCLYTTTPDSHFVIDFYPGNDRIIIASPCSGHGFKHSAAIGEVISELVTMGKSKIDINSFRLDRFVPN
jgi:sarcosine oxidase